ncbi:hypothetical protein SCLARK_00646 [Spiroplasma clarkii]|uniref:hypothetical protein n=1 Tax=Spiroplasma clarkii TaxID=2139 RepID=UPI000B583AFB|nr:hypothetical protein [Spiroplasma clarkii]ARU91309.1 hypothetical protein SCLARK_00646 [Spiroplasma clarkii]
MNPFDVFTYENGQPNRLTPGDIAVTGTNTWMNIALKEGLLANEVTQAQTKPVKVVGVEKCIMETSYTLTNCMPMKCLVLKTQLLVKTLPTILQLTFEVMLN